MYKFRAMVVIGSCVAIGVLEIFIHWYMSKDHPFSHLSLEWYTYRDSANKGPYFLLDDFLPAIFLGIVIGWFGWQWSTIKRVCLVILAGMEILTLQLLCPRFLNLKVVWWLPATTHGLVAFIIIQGFFRVGLVGVFSIFAYLYRVHSVKKTK